MPKRKAQLVCQHLERIPRKVLQDYPEIVRDMARGRNGIYALYRRDRLHYLGLARDLPQYVAHSGGHIAGVGQFRPAHYPTLATLRQG